MGTLLLAELRRTWSMLKAYPFEQLAESAMMGVFFYMLFCGARYVAGSAAAFGTRMDGIVVAYVMWLMIMEVFQGVAWDLQMEKTQGTLEQMMTSIFGSVRIFLMRSLANLTVTVLSTFAIGLVTVLLTGSHLHLSVIMILPFTTAIMAAVGLGFAFGSLVFVLKRVNSVLGVFQFALLAIVAIPIENWSRVAIWLGSLVPLAPSSAAMRVLLVQQRIDPLLFGLAILNGIVYLVFGIMLFRHMERRAKKQGRLGQF